ncbi:MAG: hypothetical protein J6U54_19915 [Clostridiales bacterium]|nr:hypothetical protein [Clostridiales bacterium]
MKKKILAAVALTAFVIAGCDYHSTSETVAVTDANGSQVTSASGQANTDGTSSSYSIGNNEGAGDEYTFEELVDYMQNSDVVQQWYKDTEGLDNIKGECWYKIPELQKICDAEIASEPSIINYTTFKIYYKSADQINNEVTYFEIYEMDSQSVLYNYMQQSGQLEFEMGVPKRDYDDFDKETYLATYHDMTTAERMLYMYDDSTGEAIMMEDKMNVSFGIHGLNGRFVIVVHSGLETEDGILETFSADNDRAQAIVDVFMAFGGGGNSEG